MKKYKHLRFDVEKAQRDFNVTDHPLKIMRLLGIKYQYSTPQSMYEQWWFWNCDNIPDNLPEYISELDLNPIECIGNGLSQQNAKEIIDFNGDYNAPICKFCNKRGHKISVCPELIAEYGATFKN